MNRITALGATCAATLLLAACGSTGSPGGSPTQGSPTDPTTPPAQTEAEVIGEDEAESTEGDTTPEPDDELLAGTRGDVPFEVTSASVRPAADKAGHLLLDVEGDAPTPCHQVAYEVAEEDGALDVVVTTVPGDGMCAQVIDPRTFTIELTDVDLPVTVLVNGDEVATVEN